MRTHTQTAWFILCVICGLSGCARSGAEADASSNAAADIVAQGVARQERFARAVNKAPPLPPESRKHEFRSAVLYEGFTVSFRQLEGTQPLGSISDCMAPMTTGGKAIIVGSKGMATIGETVGTPFIFPAIFDKVSAVQARLLRSEATGHRVYAVRVISGSTGQDAIAVYDQDEPAEIRRINTVGFSWIQSTYIYLGDDGVERLLFADRAGVKVCGLRGDDAPRLIYASPASFVGTFREFLVLLDHERSKVIFLDRGVDGRIAMAVTLDVEKFADARPHFNGLSLGSVVGSRYHEQRLRPDIYFSAAGRFSRIDIESVWQVGAGSAKKLVILDAIDTVPRVSTAGGALLLVRVHHAIPFYVPGVATEGETHVVLSLLRDDSFATAATFLQYVAGYGLPGVLLSSPSSFYLWADSAVWEVRVD